MNLKIHILDVKDGDAIIIEMIKEDKCLIMVIDGGQPRSYKDKVRPKLVEILKIYNKKAPDIVVCTHYDSDHIGGLIPLIEEFISDISEVWIHKTPEAILGYIEESIQLKVSKTKHFYDFNHFPINRLFESYNSSDKQLLEIKASQLLESLPQLRRLIDIIPSHKLRQVYHNEKPIKLWQEVTILGPTKNYFDSLFPPTKNLESFILEEAIEVIPSIRASFKTLYIAGINPCDQLKNEGQTSITSTNKASIIISIDIDSDRYLFTGDAGIESFKNIPNYQEELKNIFFLKVPHHASMNNISREIIELMQPIYAYSSGNRHQDEAVLFCISSKKRNKVVRSTKDEGDLYFDKTKN